MFSQGSNTTSQTSLKADRQGSCKTVPNPIFYKAIDRHRRLYAAAPVLHFIRSQIMTAAPETLYRRAATLLKQSHTTQALFLLQQAIEQGYAEAAFVLGSHLLRNGQPEQVLSWLEVAAAQRHPKAFFSLL